MRSSLVVAVGLAVLGLGALALASTAQADVPPPTRFLLGGRDEDTNAPELLQALPDYVHSFDVRIRIDWAQVDPDYELVGVRIISEMWPDGVNNDGDEETDEPFEQVFIRLREFPRDFAPDTFVVTIPLWTGKVRVAWAGTDKDDPPPATQQAGFLDWTDVKFGEDRKVEIPQATGGV